MASISSLLLLEEKIEWWIVTSEGVCTFYIYNCIYITYIWVPLLSTGFGSMSPRGCPCSKLDSWPAEKGVCREWEGVERQEAVWRCFSLLPPKEPVGEGISSFQNHPLSLELSLFWPRELLPAQIHTEAKKFLVWCLWVGQGDKLVRNLQAARWETPVSPVQRMCDGSIKLPR